MEKGSAEAPSSNSHPQPRRHSESVSPSREAIGGQKLMPKPPLLAVQKYMAPLVVALVTLKYQAGKAESPFVENPAPTWCSLGATFVYWLIVEGMNHIPTPEYCKCFQILSRAALASGVLSSVSLASIFLPPHLSFVPLIIWTVVQLVVVAWPVLHRACNWLHTGITTVFHKIHAKVVWGASSGCNLTAEESLPV